MTIYEIRIEVRKYLLYPTAETGNFIFEDYVFNKAGPSGRAV